MDHFLTQTKQIESMSRFIIVLLVLVSFSCSKNEKMILQVRDVVLKIDEESFIENKLAELGIIDITAFVKQSTIDQLHLKLARSENKKGENMISIIMLDKNGNGTHSDFGVDMIALAPNNWNELNATRFSLLSFIPYQENQTILHNNRFLKISELGESELLITPSQPTNDYMTFPYAIPQITRNSINGEQVNFQQLMRQGKLIYFEFWGTWCRPCVAQIPDIKTLYNTYQDRLIIIGISSNDEISKLKEYTIKAKMEWPQVQMDEEIARSFGGINFFPLGVLFDQEGNLIRYNISPKEIINVLNKN